MMATKFRCKRCNFAFRVDNLSRKFCPNCGENEIEKEKSAEELVDSVDIYGK